MRNISQDIDMRPLPMKTLNRESKSNRNAREKDQKALGPGWFNMQTAPMTPELEADLRLISMRAALDPKRHYRRGAVQYLKKGAPRPLVQIGTVVEDATGFFTDRLTKRQRGQSMLDTLMRDVERQQYLKRKYDVIQASKTVDSNKRSQSGPNPFKKRHG